MWFQLPFWVWNSRPAIVLPEPRATLVPTWKLSTWKIPGSGNSPGLVVFTSYVKDYVPSQSNLSTRVLHLSSDIIFTKESTKSFLIDMDISVSRLAGFHAPLRTPWVFNPALRLFLVSVETRILINQYSLSNITSDAFVSSPINQSWASPREPSLPVTQRLCTAALPAVFQNDPPPNRNWRRMWCAHNMCQPYSFC